MWFIYISTESGKMFLFKPSKTEQSNSRLLELFSASEMLCLRNKHWITSVCSDKICFYARKSSYTFFRSSCGHQRSPGTAHVYLSAKISLCSQLKCGKSKTFFSTVYFSSVFTNTLTLHWEPLSDQGHPANFSPFHTWSCSAGHLPDLLQNEGA